MDFMSLRMMRTHLVNKKQYNAMLENILANELCYYFLPV